MSLLKEIIAHEVFPAFGCTEPISVAYAAAVVAKELGEPITRIDIVVDPGVYKNGHSVCVPNTGGARGNLIAAVIGARLRRPELKMELIKAARAADVAAAREFIDEGRAKIGFDSARKDLYIDVTVWSHSHTARVVIESSHTNIVLLEKDGVPSIDCENNHGNVSEPEYRLKLRKLSFRDLIDLAEKADTDDLEYISQGIEMNMAMAEQGYELKKTGYEIAALMQKSYEQGDITATSKTLTASASDGRMAGLPLPVMSSGGAGNQGVVAILVASNVGKAWGIDRTRILRSIVLSHLVNAYVKCYTGDLSVICGCAIAAGMGASVALVYQRCGADYERMGLAVNSVVSDLGGVFCDGAKEGCAMKVASSTDAAIRAAHLAISGQGVGRNEGITGASPEETIRNLCRITERGMASVNEVILDIMSDK